MLALEIIGRYTHLCVLSAHLSLAELTADQSFYSNTFQGNTSPGIAVDARLPDVGPIHPNRLRSPEAASLNVRASGTLEQPPVNRSHIRHVRRSLRIRQV